MFRPLMILSSAVLVLCLSGQVHAADTFATAMLVVMDVKNPRASLRHVESLLEEQGGRVVSVSANQSFLQVEWATGEHTYAVLEYADNATIHPIICVFCYAPTGNAVAHCHDLYERYTNTR